MESRGDLVGGRRVQGEVREGVMGWSGRRAERERGEENVLLLAGGRARVTV